MGQSRWILGVRERFDRRCAHNDKREHVRARARTHTHTHTQVHRSDIVRARASARESVRACEYWVRVWACAHVGGGASCMSVCVCVCVNSNSRTRV